MGTISMTMKLFSAHRWTGPSVVGSTNMKHQRVSHWIPFSRSALTKWRRSLRLLPHTYSVRTPLLLVCVARDESGRHQRSSCFGLPCCFVRPHCTHLVWAMLSAQNGHNNERTKHLCWMVQQACASYGARPVTGTIIFPHSNDPV